MGKCLLIFILLSTVCIRTRMCVCSCLSLSLQPNHLNLDFERPHFEGIDIYHHLIEAAQKNTEIKRYVTYEELQRKNREQYAIKNTKYS